ncbi:transglutaminase family protein [Candidatus Woesearchaeota archaeon]|nr:transglutaminase family protein [Candidatus Woesearchaeota archaeon]
MASRKRKADLEREVQDLEERIEVQRGQIVSSRDREQKLEKALGKRRRSSGAQLVSGLFLGMGITIGGLLYLGNKYPNAFDELTESPSSSTVLKQSAHETSTLFIDTLPELKEFLGLGHNLEANAVLDERTKAIIQSFQEKCNYILGIPMPITGEPSIETYVAATVIQGSPDKMARIRSATHYSYTNRTLLNYEVRVPNVAVSQVKSRLRNNEDIAKALDYQDPTIVRVARELTIGIEQPIAKATKLLKFVQALPYNFDIDDYPKHPLETLADGGGDCEDTSILYASLARAVGIPAAVFLIPHHAIAGVSVLDGPGWYADLGRGADRRRYTLVETNGNGELGEIARESQRAKISDEYLLP